MSCILACCLAQMGSEHLDLLILAKYIGLKLNCTRYTA